MCFNAPGAKKARGVFPGTRACVMMIWVPVLFVIVHRSSSIQSTSSCEYPNQQSHVQCRILAKSTSRYPSFAAHTSLRQRHAREGFSSYQDDAKTWDSVVATERTYRTIT